MSAIHGLPLLVRPLRLAVVLGLRDSLTLRSLGSAFLLALLERIGQVDVLEVSVLLRLGALNLVAQPGLVDIALVR